jgi:hypothetical protein
MPLGDPVLFRGERALFHDIYQQQTYSEGEIGNQVAGLKGYLFPLVKPESPSLCLELAKGLLQKVL